MWGTPIFQNKPIYEKMKKMNSQSSSSISTSKVCHFFCIRYSSPIGTNMPTNTNHSKSKSKRLSDIQAVNTATNTNMQNKNILPISTNFSLFVFIFIFLSLLTNDTKIRLYFDMTKFFAIIFQKSLKKFFGIFWRKPQDDRCKNRFSNGEHVFRYPVGHLVNLSAVGTKIKKSATKVGAD